MNVEKAINTIEKNIEFIAEGKGRLSKLPKIVNTIYLESYYFNECLLAITGVKFNKTAVIKAAKKIECERAVMIMA